jgi:NADPH:quinone reductase-like Zn-dependent oxidoreductase
MSKNMAAWLPAKFERLKVGEAPVPTPGPDEIVVRNHAVAINPVDWLKQHTGDMMLAWIKYPAVLGTDVAGEVVEAGARVRRFRPGDRLVAHALGLTRSNTRPAEGAFQLYTIVQERMAAPIPPSMDYASAAVLPLGISTAASALFQRDYLGLQAPRLQPADAGETVLIWGGSSSVGGNAIQLAVAAGYRVITTASPRNFDYVKRLGANQVFDYNSVTVRRDIKHSLRGAKLAGALALGAKSAAACIDIAASSKGKRFVAFGTYPSPFEALPDRLGRWEMITRVAPATLAFGFGLALKARLGGVKTKAVWGSSLKDNEVSGLIYGDFLPRALAANVYVAAPSARVVGAGLEAIQSALDLQKKGVSAEKLVVTLV